MEIPNIVFTGQDTQIQPTNILNEAAPACDNRAFLCNWETIVDCTMVIDYGCNVRITSVVITNSNYLNGVSFTHNIIM